MDDDSSPRTADPDDDEPADVVILTALPVEYLAVRQHLAGPVRLRVSRGTRYEVGVFAGGRRRWSVAIAEIGAGNDAASRQFERAAWEFRPRVVLFVGVAGGRRDAGIGDVVAASTIYGYELGVAGSAYLPRIQTHRAAYELVQLAQEVARGDWQRRLGADRPEPAPTAYVKPLAAGEKVVKDTESQVAQLIEHSCGDTLGVEMEGFGFLGGAYQNPGIKSLVIRGISDLLSGKSEHADRERQPLAARHAAAFAFELLYRLDPVHVGLNGADRARTSGGGPAGPAAPRGSARSAGAAGAAGAAGSEPGEVVFRTRLRDPSGPLVIAFGADRTLVVAERSAAVHRWSLDSGEELPGLPYGDQLRMGVHVVASTEQPAVAVARDRKLTITHFGDDGPRSIEVPLGANEFMDNCAGRRLATYDGRRIVVRDFADGSIVREYPCPPNLATTALSGDGETLAVAGGHSVEISRAGDPAPRRFAVRNWPMAGCALCFSPAGDLLSCATFQEIVLMRTGAEVVVQRRGLSFAEARMAVGTHWTRPLVAPGGDVLWLVRHRIAHIRWPDPEFHFLPQDGDLDDAALDPAGGLLATASRSGVIQVRRWETAH